MECGEFAIVYSQPETLRKMIGIWSERNIVRWQKLVNTTHYTYNPIDNYDRTETRELFSNDYNTRGVARNYTSSGNQTTKTDDGYIEKVTAEGSGSGEDTTIRTPNLTEKRDYNSAEVYDITETSNNTHTFQRAAFNTVALPTVEVTKDKTISTKTGDTKHTGDDTIKNTGTEKTETNYTNKANTETITGSDRLINGNTDTTGKQTERSLEDASTNRYDKETIRARGNIGVKSTQSMILEEREVVDFNIYDIITQEFKKQFCVMVY